MSSKLVLRQLWDRLWAGGIANPLTAIEQVSYLLFLKRTEDLDDAERAAAERRGESFASRFEGHDQCRWSSLRRVPAERRLSVVRDDAFPFLKELSDSEAFQTAIREAVFVIPKASLLVDAMDAIDDLPFDTDHAGDLYEELLMELALAGRNGQFRTPRHVVKRMVELVELAADDVICDPAAGTAGFLITASDDIRRRHGDVRNEQLVGFDFDITMVRLAVMNLILHGVGDPHMTYRDALSAGSSWDAYDVVLANPPFTGSIDRHDVDPALELESSRTELLFVERCRRILRPGGRCAIIVPEGVLFGASAAHRRVRGRLVEEARLRAVVSLPTGVFRPYTNVKTAIVFFEADGVTDDVLFFEVRSDGFTLDDRRMPIDDDDLQYLAAVVHGRADAAKPELADRTWRAARGLIAENEYDLTPSRYRPERADESAGEDPAVIFRRIQGLEEDLRAQLARVDALLADR